MCIFGIIIPIDELIFFRGVAQPATSFLVNWKSWHHGPVTSIMYPVGYVKIIQNSY